MPGKGLRAYLDECGVSERYRLLTFLILSSIEEERKRMRQREGEVFCLSLYASALKY
jgi:hypothetical protein